MLTMKLYICLFCLASCLHTGISQGPTQWPGFDFNNLMMPPNDHIYQARSQFSQDPYMVNPQTARAPPPDPVLAANEAQRAKQNKLATTEEQLAETLSESPKTSPERQRIDALIKQNGGTFTGEAASFNGLVQEYLATPAPEVPEAPPAKSASKPKAKSKARIPIARQPQVNQVKPVQQYWPPPQPNTWQQQVEAQGPPNPAYTPNYQQQNVAPTTRQNQWFGQQTYHPTDPYIPKPQQPRRSQPAKRPYQPAQKPKPTQGLDPWFQAQATAAVPASRNPAQNQWNSQPNYQRPVQDPYNKQPQQARAPTQRQLPRRPGQPIQDQFYQPNTRQQNNWKKTSPATRAHPPTKTKSLAHASAPVRKPTKKASLPNAKVFNDPAIEQFRLGRERQKLAAKAARSATPQQKRRPTIGPNSAVKIITKRRNKNQPSISADRLRAIGDRISSLNKQQQGPSTSAKLQELQHQIAALQKLKDRLHGRRSPKVSAPKVSAPKRQKPFHPAPLTRASQQVTPSSYIPNNIRPFFDVYIPNQPNTNAKLNNYNQQPQAQWRSSFQPPQNNFHNQGPQWAPGYAQAPAPSQVPITAYNALNQMQRWKQTQGQAPKRIRTPRPRNSNVLRRNKIARKPKANPLVLPQPPAPAAGSPKPKPPMEGDTKMYNGDTYKYIDYDGYDVFQWVKQKPTPAPPIKTPQAAAKPPVEGAQQVPIVEGVQPLEGAVLPEGAPPAEGAHLAEGAALHAEGGQPLEGAIPAEGAVPPAEGGQQLEGAAPPAEGGQLLEGAAPAEGAATQAEGGQPIEGAAPAEGAAPPAEGGQLAEGASPAEGGQAGEPEPV